MRWVFIVAVIVGLLGCAAPRPCNNQGRNYDQDNYACEGEAYQRVANQGAAGNIFMIAIEKNRCLRLKGWYECGR